MPQPSSNNYFTSNLMPALPHSNLLPTPNNSHLQHRTSTNNNNNNFSNSNLMSRLPHNLSHSPKSAQHNFASKPLPSR